MLEPVELVNLNGDAYVVISGDDESVTLARVCGPNELVDRRLITQWPSNERLYSVGASENTAI